jgi:hypothetical protein
MCLYKGLNGTPVSLIYLCTLDNIMQIAVKELHDYIELVGCLPHNQIFESDNVCMLA